MKKIQKILTAVSFSVVLAVFTVVGFYSFFDKVENPMEVEGYTAADVYRIMKGGNPRIVDIDGAGVYNMLVKLRTQPEIAKKVLDFKPTCYQGGCGKGDAAFERGYYD